MRIRVAAVIGIVMLITIGGAFIAWRVAKRAMSSAITSVTTPKEEVVDLGAIVTQVRELNRLETASMRVMHVSTTTQTYKMVPNALGGDELTFLATGDVIAGIDLSLLTPNDVWREGDGTIVLRLPPPQILVSRIDNNESKVISRKTGVLRRADIDLESRVRQTAEQGIRNEALKQGVLKLAADNAETKLAQFLTTVGARKIRFVRSDALPPAQTPQL
jgi:hypothetical protein